MVTGETQSYREAIVERIAREADDVLSFRLRSASGHGFPEWDPGAHVSVALPNGLTRQYSLCGRRSEVSTITIAVLREPAGRGGSAYLHDAVRVGHTLRLGEIKNNFPLEPAAEYVFVAGGIGITPMIPMIEYACEAGIDWRLVYGGKSRSSMAYVEQLSVYGKNVVIRPQDECGLLDFASDVTDGMSAGSAVYACGPDPMLSALESHCEDVGVELHLERFRASSDTLAGSGSNKPFVCELDRSGRCVDVGPDETIVDALERAGVYARSDCREGTCGTCETAVLEGCVEHRDSLLSEEERLGSKTMMICVSRAISDRIVLDL